MPGGLLRLDLVRAWELYFGQKGGASPRPDASIIPVVQIDDNPVYPPYRKWMVGVNQAALAANFSYVGVQNMDSLEKKSVVVVDEIIYRTLAADDVEFWLSTAAIIGLSGFIGAQDIAEDKDQAPSDNPRIGNVNAGSATSATGLGTIVPGGDALQKVLRIGATLGPGACCGLRTNALNEGITAFFRGRYYSTL